jgi:hypothetical protein
MVASDHMAAFLPHRRSCRSSGGGLGRFSSHKWTAVGGAAAEESGDKEEWPRPGGGASLSPPFIFAFLFPSPPFPYYL